MRTGVVRRWRSRSPFRCTRSSSTRLCVRVPSFVAERKPRQARSMRPLRSVAHSHRIDYASLRDRACADFEYAVSPQMTCWNHPCLREQSAAFGAARCAATRPSRGFPAVRARALNEIRAKFEKAVTNSGKNVAVVNGAVRAALALGGSQSPSYGSRAARVVDPTPTQAAPPRDGRRTHAACTALPLPSTRRADAIRTARPFADRKPVRKLESRACAGAIGAGERFA